MSSSYPSNPDPLFDNSPPPRRTPVISWLNFLVVTAVFVAGLIYFPPISDASRVIESPQWMKFLGRFHFIALHLPVGVIIVSLLMEMASWFSRRSAAFLKPAITFTLHISAWGAIFAVIFGIFLARKGGLNHSMFYAHQALGIATTVMLLLSLFFKIIEDQSGRGGILYRLGLFASVGIMSIGAHFGGNIVHGREYLLKYAPADAAKTIEAAESRILKVFEPKNANSEEAVAAAPEPIVPKTPVSQEVISPAPKVEVGAKPDMASQVIQPSPTLVPAPTAPEPQQATVYTALIAPLMEAKCNECHNDEKEKGGLRLHTYENIIKGGSNGDTVIPKDADASALVYTMEAPVDSDEHMPPDSKPQPTPEEIALVRWWVEVGAPNDLSVADASFPESLKTFVAEKMKGAKTGMSGGALSFIPVSAQAAAAQTPAQKAIDDVAKVGASLAPVSANAQELRFTAVNITDKFSDEHLKLLEPVAGKIVELNLAKTSITDAAGASIGKFSHLKSLHLENTKVTDAILPELKKLAQLEYLNLYKTTVSNKVFEVLPALKSLKSLYLWETQVTKETATQQVENFPGLSINLGWDTVIKSSKPVSAPAPAAVKSPSAAAAPVVAAALTPESKIYEAIVAPIMTAKCVSCHGPDRTRGRLKLHTIEDMLKGGADGATTLIAGDIEESLLLSRIHLPVDDDEHMPPAKEPQVTKAELSLLTWWVQNGAKIDATIAATPKNAEVEDALKEFSNNLPKAPAAADAAAPKAKPLGANEKKAIEDTAARLAKISATLMQVSQDRDWYRFTVVNGANTFTDQQALLLDPVAKHVIWADFARSKVTDKVASTLSKMPNVERLHLESTAVGDGVIETISKLQNLEYLNLYGTQVSDAQILKLASLKKLKRLYLWQSKVTRPTAKKLESMVPGLQVNIGLSEEELQNAVKPAEPAKPVAPPAPTPAKPAAPAPAKPAAPTPAKPAPAAVKPPGA